YSILTLFAWPPERLGVPDLVYTRLDGDETSHVAARGEGSYDGILAAITRLVGDGKPVIAICVVTEHSLGYADALLRLAESTGFRMHFQPQCVDTDVVRGTVSSSVSNDQFRSFWRGLIDEKRKGRPIVSSSPYLEFLSQWEDFSISAYHAPGVRCAAGRGFVYIDPLGKA